MKNFIKNLFSRSSRGLPRQSTATAGDEALTNRIEQQVQPIDAANTNCKPSAAPIPLSQRERVGVRENRSDENAEPFHDEGEQPINSKLITQNSTFSCDPEHALTGKIARLPEDIREELNQRLHNGQIGPEILPWLNDLPAVKEILAAQFKGVPVNAENLSNWRHSGYERWLRQKQNINSAEKLGKYAKDFTEAAGGRFAPAVAAISAAKMFEYLDKVNVEEADPEDLARLGMVSSALLKSEQNYTRIDLARERIRQKDELIVMTRDRFQRESVGLVLRYLGDARAKEIEASSGFNNEEKIEVMGYHMYDNLWEPRHIPTPEDFNQPPNNEKDQAQKENPNDSLKS